MREVLIRFSGLFAHRRIAVMWLLLALGPCALVTLPLLDQPGYELSAALALIHGLFGLALAIAVGRVEREAPGRNFPLAAIATTLVLWAALIPPLLAAVATALLSTRCNPFSTTAFFPWLTVPSSLVAAAAGVLVGSLTRRWWSSALGWLAVVLASAAHTVWPIVFGPQIFAYAHLAGYLPGPLYDEELHVPASLAWFRLGSVALAVALIAVRARRGRPRTVTLAASLLLFGGIEAAGTHLGFRMNDAVLAEALGGTRDLGPLVVHYPREFSEETVTRMVDDARFRFAQVQTFLGQAPTRPVTVWWYRSSEEKQRLVGAAKTQFAKPWRSEVHVDGATFPNGVLKHELVHAMAAGWGAWPFGVTASLLVLPQTGVIEGLAVAADNPVDDLRLHEWAAAMKRKALLPDVRRLMGADGFFAASAARAYTTAGSFVRWLVETQGPDKVRALYRDGDFQRAFGGSLDSLVTQYLAFLDTVPLDEQAVNQAFGRFTGGSLFQRPCAREVAKLLEEAGASGAEQALALYRRCQVLQPDEPHHSLNVARALKRLHRLDEAATTLDSLLPVAEPNAALWADVALDRVALAMTAKDDARAKSLLEAIIERQVSPTMDRTARVRLAALEGPPAQREAVSKYFESGGAKVYWLRGAVDGGGWPVAYLLGRRLVDEAEPTEALRWLTRTLDDPQTPPSVAKESARLAIEAAFAANDCARLDALASSGRFGPAFDARAGDWVQRCAFVSSDNARGAK
jgi:hypothetical protein